jgi:PAS domain S-box-containing protein
MFPSWQSVLSGALSGAARAATPDPLFRAAFEQAPFSMQVFLPDGQCLTANPAWERLWSSGRENLASYNIRKDPQLAEKGVGALIERAFAGEAVSIPPLLYAPAASGFEGVPRWVETWVYPICDPEGTLSGVVVVHQDVTGRKVVENERLELLDRTAAARHEAEKSERLYAFLAEAGTALVSSLDYRATLASVARMAVPRVADWCIVDLVEEDGNHLRIAAEQAGGARTGEAGAFAGLFPFDPGVCLAGLVANGGAELVSEIDDAALDRLAATADCRRRLASLGPCSYMGASMSARGRTLGGIGFLSTGSGRRYTPEDLRMAEDLAHRAALAIDNARLYEDATRERAAAEAALRARAESEERFRSLSTCSPVGKLTTDVAGRCTWTNPRCQAICGFTADQALGYGWLDFVHEADRPSVSLGWRETMRTGGEYSREVRFGQPGSDIRWAHVRSAPMLSSQGELIGHVATFEDITERKLAEDELRRYNDELQRFAWVASHDLKEPLRTVATYTQLLAKRFPGALDGEAAEFTRYVVDGVDRMRQLIDDLLTYSRLINARGETTRLISSQAALEWALMGLQPAIQESGAEVTFEELPVVFADPVQLGQLFQNLIGNAIKYRSAERPRIHLSAGRTGEEWTFRVRDNGIGIDPAYRERIFGVFKRLHGREYPGTGIGLAICKKIVESHGGRIWVESRQGQGATFFFTLPAMDREAPGKESRQ